MKPTWCENPDCRRKVLDLYRRGGFGNPWLCDKCYFGEETNPLEHYLKPNDPPAHDTRKPDMDGKYPQSDH